MVDVGHPVGYSHYLALQGCRTRRRLVVQILAALAVGGDAVAHFPCEVQSRRSAVLFKYFHHPQTLLVVSKAGVGDVFPVDRIQRFLAGVSEWRMPQVMRK